MAASARAMGTPHSTIWSIWLRITRQPVKAASPSGWWVRTVSHFSARARSRSPTSQSIVAKTFLMLSLRT